jgi:outer membrane protein TolC
VRPLAPGQPAELLERRPDLLALKAQLDAANARRQQAQAEWFPRSSSARCSAAQNSS